MNADTFLSNSETTQAEEPRQVENVADISVEVRRLVDVILGSTVRAWSVGCRTFRR